MDPTYAYARKGSLKYTSNTVAFAFRPSRCGSHSIRARAPMPMSTITLCRNAVELRFIRGAFTFDILSA
jgi:hypothetical protein